MPTPALRFAVITHPQTGHGLLQMLIDAALTPALLVTQDPFFIPHDRRFKPLRWINRYWHYRWHREPIRHRHRAYFTAKQHRIPTFPVQIVNSQPSAETLQALNLDYIFVFGLTVMLKARILNLPKHGTINCHPACLPHHRGRDPLFWTLKHGDPDTGITFHYLDAGIDTGKIIAQYRIPLSEFDDVDTTAYRLQAIGARKFVELIYKLAFDLPIEGSVDAGIEASYDKPVQRSDRYLAPGLSAPEVMALIRASRGHGEAWSAVDGREVKVVDAIHLPQVPRAAAFGHRATRDGANHLFYHTVDGCLLYLITKPIPS